MDTSYSLILATDLDGTFLGGTLPERHTFYEYLQQQRDRWLLVFVTGRDLDWVERLRQEDPMVPIPDYIIGDVGTTIVYGQSYEPIPELQNWVANVWGNANERIQTLLADEPGLTLQGAELHAIAPNYRVSYYYDPEQLQDSTLQKVRAAGFDPLTSADIYFDVMPRGISKGPTLLRFLQTMGLNPADTVVCGDTLNDLSLFETGLNGIVVGNAEAKLVAKTQSLPNVYHSTAHGAAGIWEGLEVYGKH